ncbi:MAG: glycerophosphotransferase [Nevskia sp.]
MADNLRDAERLFRVGFLFNHDQLHQIAHSAPIAFELSKLDRNIEVTLFATSSSQLDYLTQLATRFPGSACRFQLLSLSGALALPARALDALMPYRRVAMLLSNRALFAALDVLVVPEKTSLLLRSHFGLDALKFVYTSHGAGDRAIGFDKHSDRFDLAFMSGPKCERMLRAGLAREGGYVVIGYPKFDLHGSGPRPKLFDNDRPTVVYNPHFSPRLSSWYRRGREVLEHFYQSTQYNLIFAPHVMLFRKRYQISIDRLRIDRPGAIPERYRHCPHMLIDTGSERSCDMSYLRAADLYLGDVSSQVYEFLHHRRPCLFLDAHDTNWQGDENYTHWHAGPVTREVAQLGAALDEAFASHDRYRARQEQMFAYTFDLGEQPSSRRGADAIVEFLAGLTASRSPVAPP